MIETRVPTKDKETVDTPGVLEAQLWADGTRRMGEPGEQLELVPVSVGTRGLDGFINNRRVSTAYSTGHMTLQRTMPPMERPFPSQAGPEIYLG